MPCNHMSRLPASTAYILAAERHCSSHTRWHGNDMRTARLNDRCVTCLRAHLYFRADNTLPAATSIRVPVNITLWLIWFGRSGFLLPPPNTCAVLLLTQRCGGKRRAGRCANTPFTLMPFHAPTMHNLHFMFTRSHSTNYRHRQRLTTCCHLLLRLPGLHYRRYRPLSLPANCSGAT